MEATAWRTLGGRVLSMDERTAPVTPAQTPTSTHEHTCSMCHNIAQKCISVLPLHCANVVCVCVCRRARELCACKLVDLVDHEVKKTFLLLSLCPSIIVTIARNQNHDTVQ